MNPKISENIIEKKEINIVIKKPLNRNAIFVDPLSKKGLIIYHPQL